MRRQHRTFAALAPLLWTFAAAESFAIVQVGADDFRLSSMGGTGNVTYEATRPAVAFNPNDDEYLAVWAADSDQAPFGDGLWGIFGQRLAGATGAEVGANDFAISGVIDTLSLAGPYTPAVVHNPDRDEYLVVWTGNTGLCCGADYEVFGRRLAADGTPLGGAFQISHMATDLDEDPFDAFDPAVAYNPDRGEYLVVWAGDEAENGLVDDEFEIFGQRLSALGLELGSDDFRISSMGGTGSPHFDAGDPALAYNSVDQEYLVVWEADDDAPPYVNEEIEIYAQRLDGATTAELGVDDFRLSSIGPPGDSNFLVLEPTVAHDPLHNQYLVAWTAAEAAPALFTWALEIFAQRLSGDGAEIGADDFPITDAGGIGLTAYDAENPQVVFQPVSGTFQVAYFATDDVGGQGPGEVEIFVQEVGPDGAQVGVNDARLSDMGSNGSGQYGAVFPALACDRSRGECLAIWRGDDSGGGLADNEWEIFGQRFLGGGIFGDGFEAQNLARWSFWVP